MLEPVESILLHQQTQPLPIDHPWLALPAPSEVVTRQVLLRGRYSATVYAYAVSLLVPARLSIQLLQDLECEGLIRKTEHTQRRPIRWVVRPQSNITVSM